VISEVAMHHVRNRCLNSREEAYGGRIEMPTLDRLEQNWIMASMKDYWRKVFPFAGWCVLMATRIMKRD
jgi:hypothetical protein